MANQSEEAQLILDNIIVKNTLNLFNTNKVFGASGAEQKTKKVIWRYSGDLSKIPKLSLTKTQEIALPVASCNHIWHQKSTCTYQCEKCKGWKTEHSGGTTDSCVSGGCWDNRRCGGCSALLSNPTHHHTDVSPTCTAGGNCYCGKNPTSALGHDYSNGVCRRCGLTSCSHSWTSWSAWVYDNGVSHVRTRTCRKCPETESEEEWCTDYVEVLPGASARYYDEKTHLLDAMCSRCKSTNWGKAESHTYDSTGYCKCGASNIGGGGGGLPPKKPTLNSFSATVGRDGISVELSASASDAKVYIFNLYQGPYGNNFEVGSAGPQSSSSCTFSNLLPEQEYMAKCTVLNGNLSDSGVLSFSTPSIPIPPFKWPVSPSQGGAFSKTVTKNAWDLLQNGINIRRKKYKLPLYSFTWDAGVEHMFTYPEQGKPFSYVFYNQVINALKEIPKLTYSPGSRKDSEPSEWLATEFLDIENAMNSIK